MSQRDKIITFVIIAILVIILTQGCANYNQKEAVFIPTQCKGLPNRIKPYPKPKQSLQTQVIEILQYTESIENDLEFCKGNQATNIGTNIKTNINN